MASKAAGFSLGVSKAANIVSIQTSNEPGEMLAGLELAYRKIKENGHLRNSIVLMTRGSGQFYDHDSAYRTAEGRELWWIQRYIMEDGIPIVYSAGNAATDPAYRDIDDLPKVLEDDAHPLIIVGAAQEDGKRATFSQGGRHLTTYAIGANIEVATKEDGVHVIVGGTSIGKFCVWIHF